MNERSLRLWLAIPLVAALVAGLLLAGGVGADEAGQRLLSTPVADATPVYTVRLPVTADTTLDSANATRNTGRNWYLTMRALDGAAALLQFDTSAIPTTAPIQITKAHLRIYTYSRSNVIGLGVSAHAVKRPWAEYEATWHLATATSVWQTAGCNGINDRDLTTSDKEIAQIADAGGWSSIIVTRQVAAWVSGAMENRGLVLKGRSGSHVEYKLLSREYENPDLRPYIEVSYIVLPTPTPTDTPTPTNTPLPALLVVKTGPTGPLYYGRAYDIEYAINVSNAGSRDVTSVYMTDTLPLGTEFLSATGGGVYNRLAPDQKMITWYMDSLAAGGSVTVTINLGLPMWVRQEGTIFNHIRLSCAECVEPVEHYWEIPVLAPTATPTLTVTPTWEGGRVIPLALIFKNGPHKGQ